MSQLITASICLSDIPREKIQTGKNGKKYINICIAELREVSPYGDTHTIYASQSAMERQGNEKRVYLGHGKNYAPAAAPAAKAPQPPVNPFAPGAQRPSEDDDLPF